MGVVRVRLHGASGLKPMDDTTRDGVLDLSDPYCTLHLHETEHRGATCRKTLNPTWEEEFEFRGTEDDLVRVRVRVRVRATLTRTRPLTLTRTRARYRGRLERAAGRCLRLAGPCARRGAPDARRAA